MPKGYAGSIMRLGLALVGAAVLSATALAAGPGKDGASVDQTGANNSNSSVTQTAVSTTGSVTVAVAAGSTSSGDSNDNGSGDSTTTGTKLTTSDSTTLGGSGQTLDQTLDTTDQTGPTVGNVSDQSNGSSGVGSSQPTSTDGAASTQTAPPAPASIQHHYYTVAVAHTVVPAPELTTSTDPAAPANHPAPALPQGAAALGDSAIVVPAVLRGHFGLANLPVALRSAGLLIDLLTFEVVVASVIGSLFLVFQRRAGFSLSPRGPAVSSLSFVTQQANELNARPSLPKSSFFGGQGAQLGYRDLGLKTNTNINLKLLQRKGVTT